MADTECPPDLRFPVEITDISFHPTQDVVAVGLISGKLDIFKYEPGACKRVLPVQLHDGGIWAVEFLPDGSRLYTGSSDMSLKALDVSGKVCWSRPGAHSHPVSVIRPLGLSGMLVSGDDDGHVKVWDSRVSTAGASSSAGCVAAFHNHTDAINDMLVDAARDMLVTASGDGTLGIYDLRKGKLAVRTAEDEHELLSLSLLKNGNELVVGTQTGMLQVWQWGHWTFEREEDFAHEPDHFRGHPDSIAALLKVDEDTIVTGSEDGILRLCTVHPNKLVGVLGEHGDFAIERLAWSRDRRYIGSVSHDCLMKFWDVSYLFEDDEEGEPSGGKSRFTDLPALGLPMADVEDDEDEDDEDEDEDEDDDDDDEEDGMAAGAASGGGSSKAKRAAVSGGGAGGMDEDDEDDSDDDDDEDSDDDEIAKKRKRSRRTKAAKKGRARAAMQQQKRGGGSGGNFFSDL